MGSNVLDDLKLRSRKQQAIPCSCMEKFNTIKMSILIFKNKFNIVQIRIPTE